MWASLVAAHGLLSSCGAQAPERAGSVVAARGLSSCGTWTPEHAGSVVAVHRLSCPTACGILVPRPGIEHASPALEGGFFTTGSPGKSLIFSLYLINCCFCVEWGWGAVLKKRNYRALFFF